LNTNRSGKACSLYNNKKFSIGLGTLGFALRSVSTIFAFTTLVYVTREESRDKSVAFVANTESILEDRKNDQDESHQATTYSYLNKAFDQNENEDNDKT
jgi:hypothetical protein